MGAGTAKNRNQPAITKLSDAELVTLAVIQAFLGFTSEARFIRYAHAHLRPTPIECGRSRETTKRSDLAGWAEYGYCASHSRFFWGLRLHLATTPSGLPVAYALTGAKTDERDTCLDMIAFAGLDTTRQTLIADKGYRRASFETELNNAGITLIRPHLKSETPRGGGR